jgi:hypothetical protein
MSWLGVDRAGRKKDEGRMKSKEEIVPENV